jgi:hypothetical protein
MNITGARTPNGSNMLAAERNRSILVVTIVGTFTWASNMSFWQFQVRPSVLSVIRLSISTLRVGFDSSGSGSEEKILLFGNI